MTTILLKGQASNIYLASPWSHGSCQEDFFPSLSALASSLAYSTAGETNAGVNTNMTPKEDLEKVYFTENIPHIHKVARRTRKALKCTGNLELRKRAQRAKVEQKALGPATQISRHMTTQTRHWQRL